MVIPRISPYRCRCAALALAALLTLAACDFGIPLDERPLPATFAAQHSSELRALPMDGAHNFRDLGGYTTRDGRQLKWGMLYRSDKLSDISTTDEQYLEKLGIRRIVDFRSELERTAEPDRVAPDSAIAVLHRPITVRGAAIEQMEDRIVAPDATAEEMAQVLIDANRQFVEEYTPVYREWMQSLLEEQNYPAVFHCTAGKDRTGLAAALVLLALDVPMDTVMADYLASNRYTQDYTDRMVMVIEAMSLLRANGDAVRALFEVDKAYLGEAFRAMEEHYGSIDNYLVEGLGIGPAERERLQELLLVP